VVTVLAVLSAPWPKNERKKCMTRQAEKKEGQKQSRGGGSKQRKGRHGDKQIDEQTRIVDGGQISDKIFTSSWLL